MSNATGSFQKSEPMQLGIPNGPFWNKSHEPNPKARDMSHMTGSISGRSQRGGKSMVLAELVKRIRISADSNDIDCSNYNYIHAYIIKSVYVNRTAIAAQVLQRVK